MKITSGDSRGARAFLPLIYRQRPTPRSLVAPRHIAYDDEMELVTDDDDEDGSGGFVEVVPAM